jgi:hypothetical protein
VSATLAPHAGAAVDLTKIVSPDGVLVWADASVNAKVSASSVAVRIVAPGVPQRYLGSANVSSALRNGCEVRDAVPGEALVLSSIETCQARKLPQSKGHQCRCCTGTRGYYDILLTRARAVSHRH